MASAIRKFGLSHCDLDTMLWNVNSLLRTHTLNIDKQNTKRIPAVYYFTTVALAACYFHVYLVSMAWVVAWRTPLTGDWLGATIVASLGITSEISTTKFVAMFIYIPEIRELVDLYRACDSLVTPGSRFHDNLKKRLRVVKKRAIFFWMVIIGNGVVYTAKPLFIPGRHIMEDSFTIYGFEPTLQSPNFEISFLMMGGGLVFIVYFAANISAFLIIITGYTEAQMIALSDEMLHVWSDANEYYLKKYSDHSIVHQIEARRRIEYTTRNRIVNEFIEERLRELAKIHRTNIYMLQKVEKAYRGSIAVEFILLTFGIIVELLGRLENTYLQIPFALLQVAMDCFSGQRVMDASLTFEQAMYASKWENFSSANMKTVLLMLQMSQKTMKLSAGGVTTLSFMSFAGVMRIIYSGYTALRQLY